MWSPRAGQGPCGSVELLCCSPFPGQGHVGMAQGTELVLPMGAALPGHRPCPALLGQSPRTPTPGLALTASWGHVPIPAPGWETSLSSAFLPQPVGRSWPAKAIFHSTPPYFTC